MKGEEAREGEEGKRGWCDLGAGCFWRRGDEDAPLISTVWLLLLL